MTREGLASLFPLERYRRDGPAVAAAAPSAAACSRASTEPRAPRWRREPDCLVLIDAPDFTHRVARRVRRARPALPIVDYVSPTVWAWRPGRARAMRAYVDEVLAVLPFEPAAHAAARRPGLRLCRPSAASTASTTLTPTPAERQRARPRRRCCSSLPGSRRAEVARLMPVFGETLAMLARALRPVRGRAAGRAACRGGDSRASRLLADPPAAALASGEISGASGARAPRSWRRASSTLELALAGVPMAVAYKVAPIEWLLRISGERRQHRAAQSRARRARRARVSAGAGDAAGAGGRAGAAHSRRRRARGAAERSRACSRAHAGGRLQPERSRRGARDCLDREGS